MLQHGGDQPSKHKPVQAQLETATDTTVEAELLDRAELGWTEAQAKVHTTAMQQADPRAMAAEAPPATLGEIFQACLRLVKASPLGQLHAQYQTQGIRAIKYSIIFLLLLNCTRWASFSWFWLLMPVVLPGLCALLACLIVGGLAVASPRWRQSLLATQPAEVAVEAEHLQ